MLRELINSLKNYRTTLIGMGLAVGLYLQSVGTEWPTGPGGWAAMAVSIGVIALGVAAKDGATGSAPK